MKFKGLSDKAISRIAKATTGLEYSPEEPYREGGNISISILDENAEEVSWGYISNVDEIRSGYIGLYVFPGIYVCLFPYEINEEFDDVIIYNELRGVYKWG